MVGHIVRCVGCYPFCPYRGPRCANLDGAGSSAQHVAPGDKGEPGMWARVTTLHVDRKRMEQMTRHIDAGIIPALKT